MTRRPFQAEKESASTKTLKQDQVVCLKNSKETTVASGIGNKVSKENRKVTKLQITESLKEQKDFNFLL